MLQTLLSTILPALRRYFGVVSIATATAIGGALVSFALSWAREWTDGAVAGRQLEQAAKRLGLWQQWLDASAQLQAPPAAETIDDVWKDLAHIAQILTAHAKEAAVRSAVTHAKGLAALTAAAQPKKPRFAPSEGTVRLFRTFFLLYVPRRNLAWIPRFAFYLGLFLSIVFVPFVFATMVLSPPDPSTADTSNIAVFIFMELLTWGFMVCCRVFALLIEGPNKLTF